MPSAAPPQAEAGPPRTELEELQIKANQVTDDVSIPIDPKKIYLDEKKKIKFV